MPLPELTPETARRYEAAGVWQRRSLWKLVDETAARAPSRLAVADQRRRLTFEQLVTESANLASFLVRAGVGSGDCVALQSGNRTELAVVHLACNRADATFVPLSDAWRQTETAHLLGLSHAAVAFVPPAVDGYDFLAETQALRKNLPYLGLVASLDGAGDFDLPGVLASDAPTGFERDCDPNRPRFVMVTSGTTSLPKMSLWSDNNLWWFGRIWAEAVGLRDDDRMAGIAPAGTGATGYVFGLLFPLLHGASSILLERWSAASALDLLGREEATLATAVPTQLVKLLQEPDAGMRPFPSLRAVTNAGAPMPADAAAALERAWDCRIQTVYGATDGGVPLMTSVHDPAGKRHGTVGRPVPHTDLLLVDEEMRPVAPGEQGEILWRGPTKSFGYLNEPERTAETFWGEGYYRSGDLGRMDGDGFVRIEGRSKDVVIRGGQNISPREVEEAVAAHPSVSEAVAFGIPDPVYGERLCVAVTVHDGAQLDLPTLRAFLAGRRIAAFKLPERLEILDELPKNAAGKLSKADVRALVHREPAEAAEIA